MIANYFIIDDFSLKEFERLDEEKRLSKIEEMLDNEVDFPCCDIDQIWNGLYFLISSNIDPVYASEDFESYAKSVFIFGDEDFPSLDYISCTKKQTLINIFKEIEKININDIVFEPKKFTENQIIPNIWDKEDKDMLFEEMEMAFDELKILYKKAIAENKNILITIM